MSPLRFSIPHDEMLRAMFGRDSRYEGVFYTAVRTTGVFCRPTCPARKPKRTNVEFYPTAEDAIAAGYRPCKRCQPLDLPGSPPEWVRSLLEEIDSGDLARSSDSDLADRGLDPTRVRRWFKQNTGMTFHRFLRGRALGAAFHSLRHPDGIETAAFAVGYESLSGFRDAFQKAFSTTPGLAAQRRLLVYKRISTPLGAMVAMAEERGIVLLEFVDRPGLAKEVQELRERHSYVAAPGASPHLDQLADELTGYFAGDLKVFRTVTHTPGMSFEQSVWDLIRQIPFGSTVTYRQVAEQLGRSVESSRAVGRANGRNRIAIVVPCHRVLASDGSLGGYGGGKARKAHLLHHEQMAAARLAERPVAEDEARSTPKEPTIR